MGSAEGALFDRDVVDEVDVVDLDVSIGVGGQPAAVELDAGRLALAL